MADSIRRLAKLLILAFIGVSLGLAYWQVIRASELTSRPDNPRLVAEEAQAQRGDMYDRNGRPLVTNETDSSGAVRRVYQHPSLSPVTGFTSPTFGPSGLEAAYGSYLAGQKGNDLAEVDQAPLLVLVEILVRADEDLDECDDRYKSGNYQYYLVVNEVVEVFHHIN